MKITRTLLVKFSRGACTPEERQAILVWLKDNNWPVFPEGEDIPDEVRQKIWAKLQREMSSSHLYGVRKKRRNILKIAAVFIALIATGTFFYVNHISKQQPKVYTTTVDMHKRVVLPDSSVVFMSPNSVLTVASGYAENNRKLMLRGKAAFEVAQNAENPFTVVTGAIATTALGTSFTVSSYPDRNRINVVLSYGKVVVNNIKKKVGEKTYLKPGEEVLYDKTQGTMDKVQAKPQQFTYKSHILYFKNASLKEVTGKLARYYQVKVNANALGKVNWNVSGEFDYQPLDVVMKTIAYSCNINYEIKGNTLNLKPKTADKK